MRNDDSRLHPDRLPLTVRRWYTVAVLVVALSLTAIGTVVLFAMVQKADVNRLSTLADAVQARIMHRLDSYTATLQGAAGLVVAHSELDRRAFRVYVEQLNLRERYPGIQGIGWSVLVPAGREDPLIAWYMEQGFPHVQLWPTTTRNERQAIALIEPLDATNLSRLGFDMTSQPAQKLAMESACNQNRATATGPTSLNLNMNESREDKLPIALQDSIGFMLYFPVYDEFFPGDHLTRNEALRGFVYAEFRSELLLNGVLKHDEGQLLSLSLGDAGLADDASTTLVHPDSIRGGVVRLEQNESEKMAPAGDLLYRTAMSPEQLSSAWYSASRTFPAAGRLWIMNSSSTPAFEHESNRPMVLWFCGIGIVLSFGLFGLSRSHLRSVIANSKLYHEGIDGQRAAEINLSISKRLASSLDLQAVVQSVIDGGRELTGASFGAFVTPTSDNPNVWHVSSSSGKSSSNEADLAIPGIHKLLVATIDSHEVIRLDDVRLDVRYINGQSFSNTAINNTTAVSYLAVPVRSRTSNVLGGLIFTHHQPAHFTADHERLLLGLAAQAAIAIDNAQLFQAESMARHIAAQRSDDLARTNAELQQFSYVSSHDLQEPLRTVTQYLDLLRRRHGDKLDSQAQRYIDYASESATRMYSLLNDLLSYSRIGRDAERELVALQDVFNEVCDELRERIIEAEVKIICSDLPTVFCERSKIRLVIQNLLANALKFRSDVDSRCLVSAERDTSGTWIITVADNGIGISPEYHTIIFEVFEQLHDRESFSGTGIGLAICRKVMEQHGGRIWVESTPGAGAAFRFSVPETRSHSRPAIRRQPIDIPVVSSLHGGAQ